MRLHEKINKEILPKLAQEKAQPVLAMPNLKKVIITVGLGPFRENKDALEAIEKELTLITGQKPKFNLAKKSIAGFKLREGQNIGYQVTLRGKRMWDFIEKVNSIVLPRIRDFDGINPKSFDRSGNLSIALKEQINFPEIKADEIRESWGMGITLTLKNPQTIEEAQNYFKQLGFIFKEQTNNK